MKKFLTLLFVAALCLSLAACGEKPETCENAADHETIKKYEKYEAIIDLLEKEDYDSAQSAIDRLREDGKTTTTTADDGKGDLGDADTSAPTVEVVELTVENWFDYFEVVEVVDWKTNAFDEVVEIDIWHCFKLKDEWGKVDDEQTEIALEYRFTGCIFEGSVDYPNKTYEVGEMVSSSEQTDIVTAFANRSDANGNEVFRTGALGWNRLGYNEREGTIHYYTNFIPVRVQGSLYLIKE